MLATLYKINFFICLSFVANCNSYDWKKGLNSDNSFNFENREFAENLDDLLNYKGNHDADFSKNNEIFEDLLNSFGFDSEDKFDVNFDAWGDLDENNHSNRGNNEQNDGIPQVYRRALENVKKLFPYFHKEEILRWLKNSRLVFNYFNSLYNVMLLR